MVFVKFSLSRAEDAENDGQRIHFDHHYIQCFLWCQAAVTNYLLTGGGCDVSINATAGCSNAVASLSEFCFSSI